MDRSKKANGIFTALGAATGLGNALRFPSLCCVYGGAFVVAYVICLTFVCFPLLCAELSTGKRYAENLGKAFRAVNPRFGWLAYSAAINSAVIALYYGVIGAKLNGAFFLFATCGGSADVSGYLALIFGVPSLFLAWIILRRRALIARTGKVCVVGCLTAFAALAVAVMVKGGSLARVFLFDGGNLAHGGLWADALGQSLLSLSLAGGVMPTFARAFPKDFNVTFCALKIIAANLLACLLAAVAALGLSSNVPQGGVTLAVALYSQVIASAFSSPVLRRIFGTFFFGVLWLVCLQSACSLFTPLIGLAGDKRRGAAATLSCLLSLALLPLFGAGEGAALGAADRMACSVNAVIIAFCECLALSSAQNVRTLKRECGAFCACALKYFCPIACGALALFSLCGARFSVFPPYARACAYLALACALLPAALYFALPEFAAVKRRRAQKS